MKMYLNSIKTQFNHFNNGVRGWQFPVSCVCEAGHDFQPHGWLSVWMREWTTEPDTGSEYTSAGRKCGGEQRHVRATSEDYWLHNGWRGSGVGASPGLRCARLGSEQAWAPASGDINAESHRYGGTLLTVARWLHRPERLPQKRQEEEENTGQER